MSEPLDPVFLEQLLGEVKQRLIAEKRNVNFWDFKAEKNERGNTELSYQHEDGSYFIEIDPKGHKVSGGSYTK